MITLTEETKNILFLNMMTVEIRGRVLLGTQRVDNLPKRSLNFALERFVDLARQEGATGVLDPNFLIAIGVETSEEILLSAERRSIRLNPKIVSEARALIAQHQEKARDYRKGKI